MKEYSASLKASIIDVMFFSAMVGLGEAYLGAFAISLGASTLLMGMLGSLPQFIGALCQGVAMSLMRWQKSRRTLICQLARLQGAVWIPLAIMCFLPISESSKLPWLVLILVVAYHLLGNLTAPVWNSLIGDLVTGEDRARFFGYRNSRAGVATFLALLIGGGILAFFQKFDLSWIGFFVLFVLAGFSRFGSAHFLAKHEDPPFEEHHSHYFSFLDFLRRLPHSNFAKFTLFLSCMNGAVALSGPFVSLYLLRDLGFSYAEFTAFAAVNLAAQFFTFFHWGKFCHRFGAKGLLTLSSFGIAIFPICLCVSSNYSWLLLTHGVHGFFWAAYMVATQVFILDAVTPEKRARCVAYQSMVNGFFVYLGALAGAGIASQHLLFLEHSSLLQLFLLSGLLRFLCAAIFRKRFEEVREIEELNTKDIVFRIAALRPIAGARIGIIWVREKAKQTKVPLTKIKKQKSDQERRQ